MRKLFLDFETFWSDDFTLKKISPAEYVMDPRFETLGCAFVEDTGIKQWVDGPDLPVFFKTIDWQNTFVISHNALFDAVILAWRYGIVPGFYGDTLSMARNWLSHSLGSLSLASLAEYYGMPAKWDTVNKLKGVNFHYLKSMPDLHGETKSYAIDDAIKCRDIYYRMRSEGFPGSQLELIDMVIRMSTQPRFEADLNVLCEHLATVKNAKQALLDEAGLEDPSSVMSDLRLRGMLLMRLGWYPSKVSPTTGKETTAFSKKDKEFTDLLDHEDPWVQAVVAARLGHKSTLEETRCERMIKVANVAPGFPVPLKYSGAHTHRFSGDWSLNMQNLQRGSPLRHALRAPKGHLVVSVDASQIEARFNATLSLQVDLVEAFRAGHDVYAEFAEQIYHHPIRKDQHPTERFVGKTAVLSLGYGSSAPVFQSMCRHQGNVILSDSEAQSIVTLYRGRYPNIVQNWKHADGVIMHAMMNEVLHDPRMHWGPCYINHESIVLPSGNLLRYRDLHREEMTDDKGIRRFNYVYFRGNRPHHIYGAKLVENVVQALAFVHIMEVAKRVKTMTEGALLPAHQVHDELIYVVPEHLAELVRDLVVSVMAESPLWMPLAPLAAEGKIGESYGATK